VRESAGSKPAPFAEKQNAKSAALPRVEIATELNAGAARDDGAPAANESRHGFKRLAGPRWPVL
jgi:hypothetical protein